MQAVLKRLQGDKVIWMIAILLSLLSILAVYSAISALAFRDGAHSLKYLFKHTIIIGMGFGVMFVIHKMRFKYFSRVSMIMIWVAIGLLVLTWLFGSNVNNAVRWLKIPGTGLTFQTSDFAKIVLITFVARQLNVNRTKLHDFRNGVMPILWPILAVCGLIFPSDLSTAALIFMVCYLMMFFGGVPIKHLLKIAGAGVAGILLLISLGKGAPDVFPRFQTWVNRIENFGSDEGEGNYQNNLAQVAIWKGGLAPNMPGSSLARNYLPHPYSDMIYAFIIEEYGAIFGGLGLLMLYLILLFRSIRISLKCPKHFGGLLVLGLSFMIVSQAFVNMAVAVNLFPNTGQPLPMVSMGGTSMIFTALAIGMILCVSRSVYNQEDWDTESVEINNEIKNIHVSE